VDLLIGFLEPKPQATGFSLAPILGGQVGGNPMKKYFVAASLIVASVVPALAADYYVALRVGGGGCEVMSTAPTDTKKYKMMGKYSSEADAKAAMAKMAECK
jgi:hypothetical protein